MPLEKYQNPPKFKLQSEEFAKLLMLQKSMLPGAIELAYLAFRKALMGVKTLLGGSPRGPRYPYKRVQSMVDWLVFGDHSCRKTVEYKNKENKDEKIDGEKRRRIYGKEATL